MPASSAIRSQPFACSRLVGRWPQTIFVAISLIGCDEEKPASCCSSCTGPSMYCDRCPGQFEVCAEESDEIDGENCVDRSGEEMCRCLLRLRSGIKTCHVEDGVAIVTLESFICETYGKGGCGHGHLPFKPDGMTD